MLKDLVCHTSPCREMRQKVREGKHQHLGHHGLINLIVVDALKILRIHVLWSKFIEMDKETFINTEALTPSKTPTSSVGGREGKTKEEDESAGAEEKERQT